MKITLEQTVGQIVAGNPATARVFERHRIDYCCQGKVPLSVACERRGLSHRDILEELAVCALVTPADRQKDWTAAPLPELVSHIVDTHHAYLREELPRIQALADRVAKVHGDHAPEVLAIQATFFGLREELESHMEKEEHILFPWVDRLHGGQLTPLGPQATVANPIQCMEKEHEDAGKALEELRRLSNDFKPPMDACNTWRVLYTSLRALEKDMHIHVHKENSILFPRALQLENSLL